MFCIFLKVFLGLTSTITPTKKTLKLFYKSMISTTKWTVGLTAFVIEKAFIHLLDLMPTLRGLTSH